MQNHIYHFLVLEWCNHHLVLGSLVVLWRVTLGSSTKKMIGFSLPELSLCVNKTIFPSKLGPYRLCYLDHSIYYEIVPISMALIFILSSIIDSSSTFPSFSGTGNFPFFINRPRTVSVPVAVTKAIAYP